MTGARMGGANPSDLERLTVYGRALGLAFQIVDDVLDITADLDRPVIDALTEYGHAYGMVFQIVDDVLDITADLQTLGKDPGSDREAGKTTFVDLLGVDGARARAQQVMDDGLAALAPLGDKAEALRALGRYTVQRDR